MGFPGHGVVAKQIPVAPSTGIKWYAGSIPVADANAIYESQLGALAFGILSLRCN